MPRYIEIDGKRHLWRDVMRLRRDQSAPKAQQPTLFEMREDARPAAARNAAGRYREPSLFEEPPPMTPDAIIATLRRERRLAKKRLDDRAQREHRTLYMQHWREKNREHYNQYHRLRKRQRRQQKGIEQCQPAP